MASQQRFDEFLTLIDECSAALRAATAAAPDPAARVPGCPDWTLADLVEHVGGVQRFWAVVVTAADDTGPPPRETVDFPSPTGDLVPWSAESTRLLLDALRAAGPASPSWSWWAGSGAPLTAFAVARHQVQEAGVHARDAQETIGKAEPLPAAVAVDGVAEFLSVGLASQGPWPHRPARIAFSATDGPTYVVDLSPAGASFDPAPAGASFDPAPAGASFDLSPSGASFDPAPAGDPIVTVHAPASDLVLALYNRVPLTGLPHEGDPEPLRELAGFIGT